MTDLIVVSKLNSATVTSLCRFGDKLRWDNTAMNLETHSLYYSALQ